MSDQETKAITALSLLNRASGLVGHPAIGLSASVDLACDRWQTDYEQYLHTNSAHKQPLSSLANSKEDCEAIAKMLCGGVQYEDHDRRPYVDKDGIAHHHTQITLWDGQMHYYLCIYDNGMLSYRNMVERFGVPTCLQICAYINERYEIKAV